MNHYKYEEIEVGHTESFTVTVTEEAQNRFCEITGDVNPLHCDLVYAKELGYNQCVVFGMLTASYLSALAGVYLPGERSLLHSVRTKFSKPVYAGDTLTVEGTVAEKNDTFNLLIVKAVIRNQDGVKVCKAELQVGVRP
ncbi:MAG TPA: MaoC family dehydratase [Lachnospiraceae bacterium]|nr:MaoC family dehydratase [Lachnospiraceae bacterium]